MWGRVWRRVWRKIVRGGPYISVVGNALTRIFVNLKLPNLKTITSAWAEHPVAG